MSTVTVHSTQSGALRIPTRAISAYRPGKQGTYHGIALAPLLPKNPEEGLSSLGKGTQSVINDASGAFRTALSLPFEPWLSHPMYPDAPNTHGFQVIGATSATNFGIGLMNLHGAVQSAAHADDIGDKRGVGYKIGDGLVSGLQSAFGADYAVFRVANIGQCVTAGRDPVESARWGDLSNQTGLWGNYLGAALYGGLSISEGLTAWESYSLERKLKGKTDEQQIVYLKNRLHADEDTLIEKEKKRLSKAGYDILDPDDIDRVARENIDKQGEAVALQQQKGMLESQIKFMREHGMCRKDFTLKADKENDELGDFVRQRLGQQILQQHGKELLVQKLKEKKITKLTRRMGAEAVKELEKPADKIELAKIQLSHSNTKWSHTGKAVLYGLGCAGMIALCIFTGGVPALVISILLAFVFMAELRLSYNRMQEMRQDHTAPPGKYDAVMPAASRGLAVATITTSVILAVAFGLLLWPLLIPAALTLLWIVVSSFHLTYIAERRANYIKHLLEEKEKLEIHDFAYIVAHSNNEQIDFGVIEQARDKLSPRDRIGIQQSLSDKPDESAMMKRARYKEAIEKWTIESQKLALDSLCIDLADQFGDRFNT